MRNGNRILRITTLLYIYIPVVIFLIGMTAWYVSSVTLAVLFVTGYKMFREFDSADKGDGRFVVSTPVLISSILIITITAILLGFGGLMGQPYDWDKHNAVLHDLIDKDWPVMYTSKESAMLTYYVGQYLVPSLIGKLGGFELASLVMAFLGISGLVLVYLNLVKITGADTVFKQIRCLVIFVFFNGALILAQGLLSLIFSDSNIPMTRKYLMIGDLLLQYRSNAVMLRWVYPQIITIWLICLLFYEHRKDIRFYVMLLIPSLLFGSFSAVFLAGTGLICAVVCLVRSDSKGKVIKDIFSIYNIGVVLSLGTVLILYYLGYIMTPKPQEMSFGLVTLSFRNIFVIIVFDLFMFGIFMLLTWAEHKRDAVFYCCLAFLTVLPLFRMGHYNDLVMGMSVPALFYVMMFVIKTLNSEAKNKAAKIRRVLIVIFLVIGAWYPVKEFTESFHLTSIGGGIEDYSNSLEKYTDRASDEKSDLVYNYFTYEPENTLFYKYIAR